MCILDRVLHLSIPVTQGLNIKQALTFPAELCLSQQHSPLYLSHSKVQVLLSIMWPNNFPAKYKHLGWPPQVKEKIDHWILVLLCKLVLHLFPIIKNIPWSIKSKVHRKHAGETVQEEILGLTIYLLSVIKLIYHLQNELMHIRCKIWDTQMLKFPAIGLKTFG